MNGNFNLVNLQGSNKIKVEGWLDWDDSEEGATAQLNIAVTQETITASGTKNVAYPDDKWDVVINNTAFKKGTASGSAGAVVTNGDNSASSSWVSGPIQVK
jgi:hypothetical protein